MTTELTTFDYGQLDGKTADFLRTKERNMREIVGRAYTELGRELKEAQDALAGSRYDGVFVKWIESLGYSTQQVYRLMQRYAALTNCENGEQRQLLEDLPVSLSYEIAAPSAEKSEPKRQAKAAVLNGDITTLKEYRELVAKLGTEEKARKEAEARADAAAETNHALMDTLESLKSVPPRIEVQREVYADPTLADRLARYEARFGDIDGEVTERITNHTEVDGAASAFSDDVQTLLLRYAHLTTYRSTFTGLSDESYDEYRTSLDALKDFVNGMERVMSATPKGKAVIIDINEYKAN
ncbi:hypothetical protein M6D81_11320 [Paenibacillus sp. J5C_2022]|uniref:hypothetical protein n=1 Tax=Paenibacillus sp. J5C2022 TaxID=2977129 RepID=UPI0021D1AE61|nr:hypothetical protein [Paenibacillus sp. J5C2022]MCU6709296.1 hypothetical protein [Paenibacillus sp. J5C2022]